MLHIVYESRTGQVKRFVDKVHLAFLRLKSPETPSDALVFHRISKGNIPNISTPFHMLTYTDGFGVVPEITQAFLDHGHNGRNILSIGSSGNKNWGTHQYGRAADIIAHAWDAQLSLKWELAGTVNDVVAFMKYLHSFENESRLTSPLA